MSSLRDLGRLFLPPILAKPLARLLPSRERPAFEYLPEGWKAREQDRNIGGWNTEGVVAAEQAKWETFRRNLSGAGPLGFSHESTDLTVTLNIPFHNIHIT